MQYAIFAYYEKKFSAIYPSNGFHEYHCEACMVLFSLVHEGVMGCGGNSAVVKILLLQYLDSAVSI